MKIFPGTKSRILQRPPGTPVFVGRHGDAPVELELFDYGPDDLVEKKLATADEAAAYRDSDTVTWLNVNGVHDINVLETIGVHFGIHPLAQEDVANTAQRPKVETYPDNLFVVLRMFRIEAQTGDVHSEQVSLILNEHSVITFQERPGDVFDTIRDRIRSRKGRIRRMGNDYLLYALLDAVVDNYFLVLEALAERVETAEDAVLDNPVPETQHELHALRKEIIGLRKSVWPLREAVSALEKGESALIAPSTRVFLRDLYDHVIQLLDTIETLREILSGLFDLYLSSVSNRMNEVMKVLTMIATIFIPITFIAGIYGMNFTGMPELDQPWGYPAALTAMGIVAGIMLAYFKRKRWF